MNEQATLIARAWRREFGDYAKWYLRREADKLERWGVAEGADLYRSAASLCRTELTDIVPVRPAIERGRAWR